MSKYFTQKLDIHDVPEDANNFVALQIVSACIGIIHCSIKAIVAAAAAAADTTDFILLRANCFSQFSFLEKNKFTHSLTYSPDWILKSLVSLITRLN